MVIIIHGSKGDIASYSPKLLDQRCPKCNMYRLQHIRYAKFKTVFFQKAWKEEQYPAFKCIATNCGEEYVVNQKISTTKQKGYVEINDKEKLKDYLRKRDELFVNAKNATYLRYKLPPVNFTKADPKITSFDREWRATPKQLLRTFSATVLWSTLGLGLLWIGVLMIALIADILFYAYWPYVAYDATRSVFRTILIGSIILATTALIKDLLSSGYNAVRILEGRVQIMNRKYNPMTILRDYIIPSPDLKEIIIMDTMATIKARIDLTSTPLTNTQIRQFLQALANNGLLAFPRDRLEEVPEFTLQDNPHNPEPYFYTYYQEYQRLHLTNAAGPLTNLKSPITGDFGPYEVRYDPFQSGIEHKFVLNSEYKPKVENIWFSTKHIDEKSPEQFDLEKEIKENLKQLVQFFTMLLAGLAGFYLMIVFPLFDHGIVMFLAGAGVAIGGIGTALSLLLLILQSSSYLSRFGMPGK